MKIFSSILILVTTGLIAFGQPIERREVDSLLRVLSNTKQAADRISILIRLAQFQVFKPGENKTDFDSATEYLTEAGRLNESARSPSLAGQLLLTQSFMLREKGQQENARQKVEEAIKIFESSNDQYNLGKALYELSGYYDYRDSAGYIKKVNLVEQSIAAFSQSKGTSEKAEALKMLGDLYGINGDPDKAIDVLKQALVAYDSVHHKALQGVYDLLGRLYYAKNVYKEALYYELLALKTAKNCRDTTIQLCGINATLAALYAYSGNNELSIKFFKEALKIAIKYEDSYAVSLMLFNICRNYAVINKSKESLDLLSTIPAKFLNPGGPLDKAFLMMSYMQGYLGTLQYDKAEPYCNVLVKLVDDPGVPVDVKDHIYRLLASYYLGIKQFFKTRFYLTRNNVINPQITGPKSRALNEKLWYKLDSAEKNYGSAFYHLLNYKTLSDSLLNETKTMQLQQLDVEYETAKKEDSLQQQAQHISLLQQRNNLQQTNLNQTNLIKNITIAGTVLILIALVLLYLQLRKNQSNNRIILQKNQALKEMLAEKEWWLKEVHHRVKNNLHTIICLLESQAMYLEKDALKAIEKSQHRIYAMSLIHQKLYQNEDLQVIDMSIYLEEFIGYLKDSFDTQEIEFILKVDPVQLNLQQAIPVALIINEGVTNSIKYAFGNEGKPRIYIAMAEADENVMLTIMDNGRGFEIKPEDEGKSLGMQLIKGLSKELKGTVRIDTKSGTRLSVEFKRGPLTDQMAYVGSDKDEK